MNSDTVERALTLAYELWDGSDTPDVALRQAELACDLEAGVLTWRRPESVWVLADYVVDGPGVEDRSWISEETEYLGGEVDGYNVMVRVLRDAKMNVEGVSRMSELRRAVTDEHGELDLSVATLVPDEGANVWTQS